MDPFFITIKVTQFAIFVIDSLILFNNFNTLTGMNYTIINTEYLDSVSGGDPEITCELINIFKEQVVEIFNEMTAHLSSKNYPLLGLLAHKAKSSVAIMGMNDLAMMLKTLELKAREGKDPELYESYILRYKKETDAAIIELDDLANLRSLKKNAQ
jgi:HPt (histidine-containing phosphotransfer) domain-containing protein